MNKVLRNIKKILIIMAGDFHYNGGIENYILLLIDLLEKYYKNFQIDIVLPSCKYEPEKIKYENVGFIYYKIYKPSSCKISFLAKIENLWKLINNDFSVIREFNKIKNDYDLIINSSYFCFHSTKRLSNYYLIQHIDIDKYCYKLCKPISLTEKIRKIISFMLNGSFDFFKHSKNIIVYDKFVKNEVEKVCSTINIICIALPSKIDPISIGKLLPTNRKGIIFLGRLCLQKNIDALIEINKQLNLIDFYGSAENDKGIYYKEVLLKNGRYKGQIINSEELKNTLLKYKFLILYSTHEGFSFSLVEALSQGLPIIVKNSYLSAPYLCNGKTGLLLPKDTTVEQDVELIKKFISMPEQKYHEYQINCVNFYNENLNINIFNQKWCSIFDKYLDKK